MNRVFSVLLLLIAVPTLVKSQPLRTGSEFQANTYTTDSQWLPSVASDADGNFVVVWNSYGQDGSYHGIFGQRFASNATPLGGEFQVNSFTTARQFAENPAVASDAEGNFVVVWTNYGQYPYPITLQRFASDGSFLGGEFQANSFTTGSSPYHAHIGMAADGNFVVVWNIWAQDGDDQGVFGQHFGSDGTPQGDEFQVNTFTTGLQWTSHAAVAPGGNFVVVWESYPGQDGDRPGIFGQRFSSGGIPQGTEFQVNTYTTGKQRSARVAMDTAGNFVVMWNSYGQDGDGSGVFGQRFGSDGSFLGEEYQLNSYTTYNQYGFSISMDARGNFVGIWSSWRDEDENGVFGQRFSSDGLPIGGEFQANSYTTGHQVRPSVAADADGDFVVVWDSLGPDGDAWGVFGQRFLSEPPKDELAADFGASGLWHYNASIWVKRTGWNPEKLLGWGNKLVADFGPSRGLWLYGSGGWMKITSWQPAQMVTCHDKLVAAFGPGRGVWIYDTSGWTKLTSWDPEKLSCCGAKIAADFGSVRGTWIYDSGSWSKITKWDPYELVCWGGQWVAAFNAGRGLWLHNTSGWTKLTSWEPEQVVACADKFFADFGMGRGLWLYDSSGWTKITSWDSYDFTCWGGKLAAAFDSDRGLWLYDVSSGWTKITGWEPVRIEALAGKLVGDFGSGRGIYTYDTDWTKISGWNSEELEAVNLF